MTEDNEFNMVKNLKNAPLTFAKLTRITSIENESNELNMSKSILHQTNEYHLAPQAKPISKIVIYPNEKIL